MEGNRFQEGGGKKLSLVCIISHRVGAQSYKIKPL